MIREENLTLEIIRSLQLRFCGTMFGSAMYLGIWFDDAEIKYIETKMMTHPKYRLVSGRAAGGDKTWYKQ